MKRYILILMVLFLAMPGVAAAAGTVTGAVAQYEGLSGKYETMVVTYTVTFGAAAGSPANTALNHILSASGVALPSVERWWLFRVYISPDADTGPTDNTDFYLWYVADGVDVLGDNGANTIDNATYSSFYPAVSTQPLTGEEIFDIDNNAVNNAICTIVFILYK